MFVCDLMCDAVWSVFCCFVCVGPVCCTCPLFNAIVWFVCDSLCDVVWLGVMMVWCLCVFVCVVIRMCCEFWLCFIV